MTVAFDISYIQRSRTGIGRASGALLDALLAQDARNSYILHGWSCSLDVEGIETRRGENVRIQSGRLPGHIKRFYWNRLRWPPLESIIAEFDVFHSADPMLPPLAKAKGLVMIHDLAYKKFPHFFERHVVAWDKFVARSVERADAIIVPSEQTRSDLLAYFPPSIGKIHLVRFPISSMFVPPSMGHSDPQQRPTLALPDRFILYVGTIEPRKNLERLIQAFELFSRPPRSDVHLLLVGKLGWLYDGVFDRLNHSPVRHRIHHAGYVEDRHLPYLYRRAEFFVYPSLYEGYGFPVLEAMASGTAVITSNSSSLKEIAQGASILINPASVEEMAEAMQLFADNPSLRAEYSRRGLIRAGEFSAQEAADAVLNLYQSLVHTGPSLP